MTAKELWMKTKQLQIRKKGQCLLKNMKINNLSGIFQLHSNGIRDYI